MAEQPDVGVTALPFANQLVERRAALLADPALVEAEIHHVSARQVDGLVGDPDGHPLAPKPRAMPWVSDLRLIATLLLRFFIVLPPAPAKSVTSPSVAP